MMLIRPSVTLCASMSCWHRRVPTLLQSVCTRSVATGSAAIHNPLHFVNGQRVTPLNSNSNDDFEVLEPATGKHLCTVRSAGKEDVNRAVVSAKTAYKSWRSYSGMERGKILRQTAIIIRSNLEEITRTEVHDTGKPIWEVRADIEACADTMDYMAGLAPTIVGEHIQLPNGSFAFTKREPIGVVAGIGSFNYPFQMSLWKSAAALACGNTIVFKPSEKTPLSCVLLGEAYTEAGLPPGCYNVLQGQGAMGGLLTSHPSVSKVTFTGSVPVGAKVMATCAKDIKKVTLELGGKSPLIIFDDADLDNAVKGAMLANFLSQGQVCSNGTRVFVQKSIFAEFLRRFKERTEKMKIGDPFDESTTVGAMITRTQADNVLRYIDIAKKEGARIVCGGEVVKFDNELSGGIYISPCILTNAGDDTTIAREEVFGSVATVFEFDTEQEVIRRANDTEFGLAGGVFTKDLGRAFRVASEVEAGVIYVNNYNVYPSELPFGGYKKSGIGRENGRAVIEYFTQIKSVYVEMGDVDCPL